MVYHKLTQNERLEVDEMAHIDVPKVRGKMAEKGITLTRLAELLGINRNTLSSYFETPGKIPYDVVSEMANILCDNKPEAVAIFFCP